VTFLDLVRMRRSVRRYEARPVPREALDRCFEAVRFAPSACHSEPWQFVVVDEPERRRRLAERAFAGMYSINRFAVEAPALVVVITEQSKLQARLGALFRGVRYGFIDIGIACEHFVLQAAAEGLGTCWLGWFDEKAVKAELGLPRSAHVDVLISVGYPAGEPPADKRRKTLDELRRYA
jgi:nitroreductase